jgi:hypothetical protein
MRANKNFITYILGRAKDNPIISLPGYQNNSGIQFNPEQL